MDRDGGILAPLVLHELPVFLLTRIQLSEAVALPIWSYIKRRHGILATDQKRSLNDGVVALAIDGRSPEDVFAGCIKASKETTDQVVGHERQCKLIVVFVVNSPQLILLGIVVFPKPG